MTHSAKASRLCPPPSSRGAATLAASSRRTRLALRGLALGEAQRPGAVRRSRPRSGRHHPQLAPSDCDPCRSGLPPPPIRAACQCPSIAQCGPRKAVSECLDRAVLAAAVQVRGRGGGIARCQLRRAQLRFSRRQHHNTRPSGPFRAVSRRSTCRPTA